MRSYRRAPRYPSRRSRRRSNLLVMPVPPPEYRAELIGKHNEVLEIRIGGDVFRLNLSGAIEQLYETTRPRRLAEIIPFQE